MPKFVANEVLTPESFHALAARTGRAPVRARKAAWVSARPAVAGERVETRWNGVETVNVAAAGDWVVTSLDREKKPLVDDAGALNVYVIDGDKFETLYEPARGGDAHGAYHKPRQDVLALYLAAGFDIVAPWGERQRADRGYLILNGGDVYGNHADTFRQTYRTIARAPR